MTTTESSFRMNSARAAGHPGDALSSVGPMRLPRVALVMDYALDYLGGAQSAFLEQARALTESGHEVVVIAPTPRSWSHEWRPDDASFVAVAAPVTLPGLGLPVIRNTAALRRRLRAEFERRGVEVVHVHSEFGLTAAAVAVARQLRIRTVSTVHTFYWQTRVPAPFGGVAAAAAVGFVRWLRGPDRPDPVGQALREVTRRAAQRADVVVSPSEHQARQLRAAGVAQTSVLANVVATPAARGAALACVELPLRVLWIGRIEPEKRLLEFIEAVALAAEQTGPGALDVRVAGDGSLRPAAERLARRLAAPVSFLGAVPRQRVRELIAESHLVALTSYGFDNQPVTVAEALSGRRSVLYSDPVLTEGLAAAGILTRTPGVDGMAATLAELVRNPQLVVDASRRAAEAARCFTAEAHVLALRELYRAEPAAPLV